MIKIAGIFVLSMGLFYALELMVSGCGHQPALENSSPFPPSALTNWLAIGLVGFASVSRNINPSIIWPPILIHRIKGVPDLVNFFRYFSSRTVCDALHSCLQSCRGLKRNCPM